MSQTRIRSAIALAASLIIASGVSARIPGTLNFQNATTTRINGMAENPGNEKEVEFGDFDNDGDLDVVIGNGFSDFGQRLNKLYRNDSATFVEVSGAPIIPGFSGTDVTRNAFFRDYDQDGWLDIIVVNDNNTSGDGGRTKVYINNHAGGVFSHFTEEGVARLGSGTGGAACGAISAELDGVAGADLYVGNYPGPSQDTMYANNGAGHFDEVTDTDVPTDSDYTVDVASADLNGDGRIDLLVSNWGNNYIYYNNNQDQGTATGDFSYAGSTTSLGGGHASENAMEPGDFDNDGDMDFYWSNASGGLDAVMVNTGNDASGKAVFGSAPALPASTQVTSRKATVADLNADGRVDVVVMKQAGFDSRPTILRNVTVPGTAIRFVDWTPAQAFPDGDFHMGWHAAAFDIEADPDGYPELFLGGNLGEHLFLNVPGLEATTAELAGQLPAHLYNGAPIAVVGGDGYVLEVLARGTPAQDPVGALCPPVSGAETLSVVRVPSGAQVAVILNGCGDYHLEARAINGALLAESDRGAAGIEEVLTFAAPGGSICLNITTQSPCDVGCTSPTACCDADGDGMRDDACAWCACAADGCAITPLTSFADVGGSFGQCSADGYTNIHDRNHIIRCFEESSDCAAVNADAGGAMTSCAPDGLCDVHDINHALNVFQATSACDCGAPMPEVPAVLLPPTDVALRADRTVRPGGAIAVHAFVGRIDAIQSYQLQGVVSGGTAGHLTLETIRWDRRPDAALGDGGPSFSASNIRRGQFLAGTDAPVLQPQARDAAYLATFIYRASSDAAGAFLIDVDPTEGRSVLIGTEQSGIPITRTQPAIVRVVADAARTRK